MITMHAHATRRLDDRVRVQVTDADGHRHQFSTDVDLLGADERLRGTDFPVPVQVPCVPVRHGDRKGLHDVALASRTPDGVDEVRVRREQLSWAVPAVHGDLSVRARQAAALVTFRRWRAAAGVTSPGLEADEEHLWQFLTVGPSTFEAWYDAGGGGSDEDDLRRAAAAGGVDADDLDEALAALCSITYDGLFSGIESAPSLSELEAVGRFTARHGVPLAPAELFVDDLWIDHSWGRPDAALVARWRSLP